MPALLHSDQFLSAQSLSSATLHLFCRNIPDGASTCLSSSQHVSSSHQVRYGTRLHLRHVRVAHVCYSLQKHVPSVFGAEDQSRPGFDNQSALYAAQNIMNRL